MKTSSLRAPLNTVCSALFVSLVFPALMYSSELHVGAASVDITPNKAVALWGQFGLRLSTKPDTPLTANVVALQSGEARTTFVSLDLLQLPEVFVQAIRDAVARKDDSIDVEKIVLTATHTHTAPVLRPGTPGIPVNDQTMTVKETISFLADKISDGIVAAWKNVAPGKMSYGLDRNSIGFSRRAVYADGSAKMYGNTNRADFVNLEGMDDDDVGSIFFYGRQDNLTAIIVNVACPAQVVESQSNINADFWLPVRDYLKTRYGDQVVVLGWGGASGDMSPRPILHKAANARMRRLRGINEMQELARRIDLSVSQTFDAVEKDKFADPILKHVAVTLQLPLAKISEAQYQEALAKYNSVMAQVEKDPACESRVAFMARDWHHGVVERYEQLQEDPAATYPVEIHVVRLGNVVICSNPFEMFCEYGVRTSWPIDRKLVSRYLGMEGLIENTNDAVSYTDGYLVVVSGLVNVTNIASRTALELSYWSGVEYGFLDIGHHCGHSFMMPQKDGNPNGMEIIRMRAGQMIGHLTGVATAGLRAPHGDVFEMLYVAEPTLAALEAAEKCILELSREMRKMQVREAKMLAVIRESYIGSTELANQMVRDYELGYRTAHEIVNEFVLASREQEIPATEARAELLDEVAQKVLGRKLGMTEIRLRELLDPSYFLKVTNSRGGVAPDEVARMIADRRQKLADAKARHLKRIETLEKAQERMLADLRKLDASSKRTAKAKREETLK